MSTHTYPTTDTRQPEPAPTYQPTIDRQHDEQTSPAATDHEADSWVARCQSQFDAARTDRLCNLVDAENQAMPTGTTDSQNS